MSHLLINTETVPAKAKRKLQNGEPSKQRERSLPESEIISPLRKSVKRNESNSNSKLKVDRPYKKKKYSTAQFKQNNVRQETQNQDSLQSVNITRCMKCYSYFENLIKLMNHDCYMLRCSSCPMTFQNPNLLQSHLESIHEDKLELDTAASKTEKLRNNNILCKFCSTRFVKLKHFKIHKLFCSKPKKQSCIECGVSVTSKYMKKYCNKCFKNVVGNSVHGSDIPSRLSLSSCSSGKKDDVVVCQSSITEKTSKSNNSTKNKFELTVTKSVHVPVTTGISTPFPNRPFQNRMPSRIGAPKSRRAVNEILKSLPDEKSGVAVTVEGKFQCIYCGHSSNNVTLACDHFLNCKSPPDEQKSFSPSDLTFLCLNCKSEFKRINNLQKHKNSICFARPTSDSNVKEKVKKHKNSICFARPTSDSNVKEKVKKVLKKNYHENVKYWCKKCGSGFISPYSLQGHFCKLQLEYMKTCSVDLFRISPLQDTEGKDELSLTECSICSAIYEEHKAEEHMEMHEKKGEVCLGIRRRNYVPAKKVRLRLGNNVHRCSETMVTTIKVEPSDSCTIPQTSVQHSESHLNLKTSYKCIQCTEVFNESESFDFHVQMKHRDLVSANSHQDNTGRGRYCQQCKTSFAHPMGFKLHMCGYNGYSFSQPTAPIFVPFPQGNNPIQEYHCADKCRTDGSAYLQILSSVPNTNRIPATLNQHNIPFSENLASHNSDNCQQTPILAPAQCLPANLISTQIPHSYPTMAYHPPGYNGLPPSYNFHHSFVDSSAKGCTPCSCCTHICHQPIPNFITTGKEHTETSESQKFFPPFYGVYRFPQSHHPQQIQSVDPQKAINGFNASPVICNMDSTRDKHGFAPELICPLPNCQKCLQSSDQSKKTTVAILPQVQLENTSDFRPTNLPYVSEKATLPEQNCAIKIKSVRSLADDESSKCLLSKDKLKLVPESTLTTPDAWAVKNPFDKTCIKRIICPHCYQSFYNADTFSVHCINYHNSKMDGQLKVQVLSDSSD